MRLPGLGAARQVTAPRGVPSAQTIPTNGRPLQRRQAKARGRPRRYRSVRRSIDVDRRRRRRLHQLPLVVLVIQGLVFLFTVADPQAEGDQEDPEEEDPEDPLEAYVFDQVEALLDFA